MSGKICEAYAIGRISNNLLRCRGMEKRKIVEKERISEIDSRCVMTNDALPATERSSRNPRWKLEMIPDVICNYGDKKWRHSRQICVILYVTIGRVCYETVEACT